MTNQSIQFVWRGVQIDLGKPVHYGLFVALALVWKWITGLSWISTVGLGISIYLSILLHEGGHIFAGLLVGVRTKSLCVAPCFNAYVTFCQDSQPLLRVSQKIWLSLGGVLVNGLLFGVCLFAGPVFMQGFLPRFWEMSDFQVVNWVLAAINLLLVCGNLLPISGTDGQKVVYWSVSSIPDEIRQCRCILWIELAVITSFAVLSVCLPFSAIVLVFMLCIAKAYLSLVFEWALYLQWREQMSSSPSS